MIVLSVKCILFCFVYFCVSKCACIFLNFQSMIVSLFTNTACDHIWIITIICIVTIIRNTASASYAHVLLYASYIFIILKSE